MHSTTVLSMALALLLKVATEVAQVGGVDTGKVSVRLRCH